jgi:glycerate-2-kinase
VNTHGTDGIGGPTLELTLSAALALSQHEFDWSVIGFTTDGIDGPSGVAGCVLTSSMLSAPIKRQAVESAIRHHDTLSICDTLGATIRTGPTGTNVNDIAMAIRWN